MMRVIVFYFIIITQIILCRAMEQHPNVIKNNFPVELIKKFSKNFPIHLSSALSLKMFNESNHFEKLYFPSSSALNFVVCLASYEDCKNLLKLEQNSKVLPQIQL